MEGGDRSRQNEDAIVVQGVCEWNGEQKQEGFEEYRPSLPTIAMLTSNLLVRQSQHWLT